MHCVDSPASNYTSCRFQVGVTADPAVYLEAAEILTKGTLYLIVILNILVGNFYKSGMRDY